MPSAMNCHSTYMDSAHDSATAADGDGVRAGAADDPAEQPGDDRGGQRRERRS